MLLYISFFEINYVFTYFIRRVQPNSPASSFPTLYFSTLRCQSWKLTTLKAGIILPVSLYIFHLVQSLSFLYSLFNH